MPSGLYLRKGHTLGSLQQAPQLIHWPLRLGETGSIEVKVLFILAGQVFFLLLAISNDVTNIPKYCNNAKSEFEVYPPCAVLAGRLLFQACICERFYDFLKTATTFSTSTTNRRLSPSKSTGIAPLGLNSTLSY